MSLADSIKQERIEKFLRKSLLGEELVNTQFHLFSARSVPSRRLTKPRVLCANNVLLAKSSKYFLDLLSSDVNASDGSLSDLVDANDVPSHFQIDDCGYESDSDLDEDDEPIHLADTEALKDESVTVSTTPPKISIVTQPKEDDELSSGDSESVSSDMFVMSPEHPRTEEPFGLFNMGEAGSVTSNETAVQKSLDNKTSGNQTAIRLRSLGSRHILVKDTAFQTWYTLLNYLYTNKINFLPLSSATPGMQPRGSSADSLDEPRCSAKSMYRLACKVGLDHLRNEALAYIQSNLSENNILKELSCSIVSSHPQLLEVELDVLYANIGSAPIVAGFPALARCIAQKELAHGADVILGIHARLLKDRQPLPLTPSPPMPQAAIPSSPHSHSPASFGRPSSLTIFSDDAIGNEPSTLTFPKPPPFSPRRTPTSFEVPPSFTGFTGPTIREEIVEVLPPFTEFMDPTIEAPTCAGQFSEFQASEPDDNQEQNWGKRSKADIMRGKKPGMKGGGKKKL